MFEELSNEEKEKIDLLCNDFHQENIQQFMDYTKMMKNIIENIHDQQEKIQKISIPQMRLMNQEIQVLQHQIENVLHQMKEMIYQLNEENMISSELKIKNQKYEEIIYERRETRRIFRNLFGLKK